MSLANRHPKFKILHSELSLMKKLNPLTPEEARVIVHKGTERPYTGELYENKLPGTYIWISPIIT